MDVFGLFYHNFNGESGAGLFSGKVASLRICDQNSLQPLWNLPYFNKINVSFDNILWYNVYGGQKISTGIGSQRNNIFTYWNIIY